MPKIEATHPHVNCGTGTCRWAPHGQDTGRVTRANPSDPGANVEPVARGRCLCDAEEAGPRSDVALCVFVASACSDSGPTSGTPAASTTTSTRERPATGAVSGAYAGVVGRFRRLCRGGRRAGVVRAGLRVRRRVERRLPRRTGKVMPRRCAMTAARSWRRRSTRAACRGRSRGRTPNHCTSQRSRPTNRPGSIAPTRPSRTATTWVAGSCSRTARSAARCAGTRRRSRKRTVDMRLDLERPDVVVPGGILTAHYVGSLDDM